MSPGGDLPSDVREQLANRVTIRQPSSACSTITEATTSAGTD